MLALLFTVFAALTSGSLAGAAAVSGPAANLAPSGVPAGAASPVGTPPVAAGVTPAKPGKAGPTRPTVVTFAWGGGNASQMASLALFRQYGMHATYYIPSGLVCFPSKTTDCTKSQYLTLSDVRKIAAYGNEIGGLTVSHIHLDASLPTAEAKREKCDDRINLIRGVSASAISPIHSRSGRRALNPWSTSVVTTAGWGLGRSRAPVPASGAACTQRPSRRAIPCWSGRPSR